MSSMSHTRFLHRSGLATPLFLVWYAAMAVWWFTLNSSGASETFSNYLYGLLFVLIPVVGGLIGLWRSAQWGFFSSALGRATLFSSLGLIAWGLGGLIYSYYNFFLGVEAPYPSIADIAYLSSYPLWAMGVLALSRAMGAGYALRKPAGKVALLAVPLLAAAVSYYLLINVARGGLDLTGDLLKIFVDVAYPTADIVLLTLISVVFVLSYKFLGGRYKMPVVVLMAGFLLQFFADFAFSWQTTLGTWYVANWVDFLFTTAMTVITVGVVSLNPNYKDE